MIDSRIEEALESAKRDHKAKRATVRTLIRENKRFESGKQRIRARHRIGKDESIVTAYAESASGPGWANQPFWVIVRKNGTDQLRTICLQPDEQGETIPALYPISNMIHGLMIKAAERLLR